MALAENLSAAKDAVAYVKSLKLRAMNLVSGRLDAAGGIDNVIGTDQGMGALRAEFRSGLSTFNDSAPDAAARFTAIREGAFAKAGPAGVGVITLRRTQREPDNMIAVRANVIEIIASRYGNCQEQAQVALSYIYTTCPTVRPLDLLSFTADGYDHVWVGIGLSPNWNRMVPDGRNGNPSLKIKKYSLREWGPDATPGRVVASHSRSRI